MEHGEEWNNFMHRVSEVSGIIDALTSKNEDEAKKAQVLADKYLSEKADIEIDPDVDIKLKCDRTLINKRDEADKKTSPNEMDKESFMKFVEIDAEERAKNKKIRKEKAETFKTRASKAFRRGDYELALSCYNKAIDQVKDSCLLYTNRALTLIKLKKYDKVFYDCEWALRVNENNFKARLYEAKAHRGMRNEQQFQSCYANLLKLHPQHKCTIDNFLKESDIEEDEDKNNECE